VAGQPSFAGAIALGPLVRLVAAWRGLPEPFWALVPAGSADSLGLGAWLAWAAWRDGALAPARPRSSRGRWAVAGLAAWSAAYVWEHTGHGLPLVLAAWRQVAQGLVFVWIVERASAGDGRGLWPVLAHPVVRYVGRISYGVYLIHAFAPVVTYRVAAAAGLSASLPQGDGPRAVLNAAVTLAVASAMWHLIEAPVQRFKTRVPYRQ